MVGIRTRDHCKRSAKNFKEASTEAREQLKLPKAFKSCQEHLRAPKSLQELPKVFKIPYVVNSMPFTIFGNLIKMPILSMNRST